VARILICDDSPLMCKEIKDILEKNGHEVVAESLDAEKAVQLYEKHKPDLVTMDIIMTPPGHYAIERIKKIDNNVKIIIISVLGPEVIDAIHLGALGLVTKPINQELLLSEIVRVLEKKPRE